MLETINYNKVDPVI